MVDLKRLNHIVALADARSFLQAAIKSNISQSAFSRSIQSAEMELGLKLFNRESHDIQCTDAGHFVIQRARKLLFGSRRMERDLELYREKSIGDLSMGVSYFLAPTLIPNLLTEMRSNFPKINLLVDVNDEQHLQKHLRSEEFEFYLGDLENVTQQSDLDILVIGKLSAGFYVRQGHPLQETESVTAENLIPYGLASTRSSSAMIRLFLNAVGLPPETPSPLKLVCDDLNLLKLVVTDTDTVLLCSDAGAAEAVATDRLTRLNVPQISMVIANFGIVSLKGRSFSIAAKYAVDYLRNSHFESPRVS
jgi:DNA-binding transcriptional LysR family regulator